jgi:sugar lactone lactonase YvrE
LDKSGNIFVADTGNNRVRKITPQGTISTVAGNGTAGFSGDNGPAISAELNSPSFGDDPSGLAVDASGNLFIADFGNNRIRKVTPQGIITTVAGSGGAGPTGAGSSGDGGLATSAQLNDPHGVAVDTSGNLFIADSGNCRIRKVTPQGIITTVAGNNCDTSLGDGGPAISAGLQLPWGVAVDASGNLFIAENDNRIRKVTPQGIITTVAGNGTAGFSGDGGGDSCQPSASNGSLRRCVGQLLHQR